MIKDSGTGADACRQRATHMTCVFARPLDTAVECKAEWGPPRRPQWDGTDYLRTQRGLAGSGGLTALVKDKQAPAFVLELRLGRLHVLQHPSLVDWSGPQRAGMMSADGWAAAARHRRRRLAATRMYVQVLVEGEEAARSRRLALSSESLTVDLRRTAGLRLRRWPRSITARIWESHRGTFRLWDRLIGEVSVAVPGTEGRPAADAAAQRHHWESARSRAGPALAGEMGLHGVVAGTLDVQCAWTGPPQPQRWGAAAGAQAAGPPMPPLPPLRRLPRPPLPLDDEQRASMDWTQYQDENEVVAVVEQEAGINENLAANWRCEPMWHACTPKAAAGGTTNQSNGQSERQQQHMHEHGVSLKDEDEALAEPMEYRRELIEDSCADIHGIVRQGFNAFQPSMRDVVTDVAVPRLVPAVEQLSDKLCALRQFHPRKPLLVANIHSALGLPQQLGPAPDDSDDGGDSPATTPFVEMEFQGETASTTVPDDGAGFTWGNVLTLPWRQAHKRPAGCQSCQDVVTLAVFDMLPDGGRRLLGQLRIAAAAVQSLQHIQGCFQLDVPLLAPGCASSERAPRLVLSLALHPKCLPLLPPSPRFLPNRRSGEAPHIIKHCAQWVSAATAPQHCRPRWVHGLAIDPAGRAAWLLPRWLAPLQPPPGYEHDVAAAADGGTSASAMTVQLSRLARLVALIPALEGRAPHLACSGVWSSAAASLAVGAIGAASRAALLAGLFLQAGVQAYLVLGTALSGPGAVWVLTVVQPAVSLAADRHRPIAAWQQHSAAADGQMLQSDASYIAVPADGQLTAHNVQLGPSTANRPVGAQLPPSADTAHAAAAAAAVPVATATRQQAGGRGSQLRLWDPRTGHSSAMNDISCPLREVHMVVSSANMWANVQKTAAPAALDWRLDDSTAWLPFFGPDALPPRHLGTLQPPIGWQELGDEFYTALERRAEAVAGAALSGGACVTCGQTLHQGTRSVSGAADSAQALLRTVLQDMAPQLQSATAAAAGRGDSNRQAARQLEDMHAQEVQAAFSQACVHSALLAVPFSDTFNADVLAAVQRSGLAATARSPRPARAAALGDRVSDDEGQKKGSKGELTAAACLVERSGVAFACCAWLYIAIIET